MSWFKRLPVGVVVWRGGASLGDVLVTWPWLKMTSSVAKSPRVDDGATLIFTHSLPHWVLQMLREANLCGCVASSRFRILIQCTVLRERLSCEENREMFKVPGKSSMYGKIRNIEVRSFVLMHQVIGEENSVVVSSAVRGLHPLGSIDGTSSSSVLEGCSCSAQHCAFLI
ncbi:hypothetical protein TNCV_4427941 [Trichonephila clavipes]|nr:hypothetical protein TNCV_4427941 [Trichonephila clavipes]